MSIELAIYQTHQAYKALEPLLFLLLSSNSGFPRLYYFDETIQYSSALL